jgi:hypothetical protein
MRTLAVLLLCLVLTGCNTIQVKLGLKVHIDKLPIASMDATLPNGPAIAPGESTPLVATFTEPTGKVFTTEGKGKGKILWTDLHVDTSVVTVNKKGILTLAHDPRLSEGKTGHVVITVPSHPTLKSEVDVPLTYAYPFTSRFAGADGSNGSSGFNGTDGTSGSSGSTDPNNPSPGGNGGNGGDGTDGGNGGDGSNGPAVTVVVTLRPGSKPLLEIGVTASGHKQRLYLVDPQGGSLTVSSVGGSGGSGGKGGSAGRGGAGGIGTPNGSNGSDGHAGNDGRAGSDGDGGSIAVTYDPSAQPYLASLHLANPHGPKPQFTQAPVAPLW